MDLTELKVNTVYHPYSSPAASAPSPTAPHPYPLTYCPSPKPHHTYTIEIFVTENVMIILTLKFHKYMFFLYYLDLFNFPCLHFETLRICKAA